MLKRRASKDKGQVVVTFVLPEAHPGLPASVAGEFNGWDPAAHPLRKRSNGTWSTSVTLERGRRFRFRYRSAAGEWFNDEAADEYVANAHGSDDCVVVT